MSNIARIMQQAAAGAAGEALAIEDVFSTYLYTGNGSTQTITNGIDLDGEGGLVWIKRRTGTAVSHILVDSERGDGINLQSNSTDAEINNSGYAQSLNSDGFTVYNWATVNGTGDNYASWTFRKAERFFDVVTYTGTGANRTVAHNLGVVPGCIIIKETSAARNWYVYHRSTGNTKYLNLNLTNAAATSSLAFNNTDPTATEFTVGTINGINNSGATYVAYLFAHDPLGPSGDGSDGLIACGSFSTTGSDVTINLGWEPQWLLVKRASGASNWGVYDAMRGLSQTSTAELIANGSIAETVSTSIYRPILTSTGFIAKNSLGYGSGETITYIAIRRGPMREPTSGTEVFAMDNPQSLQTDPGFISGFPVDLGIFKIKNNTLRWWWTNRVAGEGRYLESNSTAVEGAASSANMDYNNGWWDAINNTGATSWMFRRAPGFFDVVAYTGTGSVSTFAHNLGVKPQMIWTKGRNDSTFGWYVYHEAVTAEDQLYLHLTNAAGGGFMNNTEPTDEVFTLGVTSGANASGEPFIAYLFATLPGVSKVGSYTGNGSSQTINCGFTGGARFVLIKRTDSTGDWYVWDTARGIVAGNDPHLSLNTTAAEVTSDDSIDPDSSGFIVNQLAATNINVSSATYIYLAIA